MWKEKLNEIIQEQALYDEDINSGANSVEIQSFLDAVKMELNVELPAEYIDVLKIVNGLEYNGCVLYGIDEYLLESEPNQSINGLIDCNKIWYENEWQKQYVFLGDSSICWYVWDTQQKVYCELDKPSGRLIQEFDNVESMINELLTEALL